MVAAERTLDVRLDGPSAVWPFTDIEDGDVMVGNTSDGLAQAVATVPQGDKDGGSKRILAVLAEEPRNETAWIWACDVAQATEGRIH